MNVKRTMQRAALAAIWLLLTTSAAYAGGGNVLPANARPHGYSLAAAASATAYFNEGTHQPDTVPAGFPFQILYVPPGETTTGTFHVRTGTMFYMPLVYSDDNDAAAWPFPDVNDAAAVSSYYFDSAQLGAELMEVTVDGQTVSLGPQYAVGAVTPGLPSGADTYTVVAVVLGPLGKGTHTVSYRFVLSGDFLDPFGGVFAGEATYTVIVH
jgi:hypothetical protein